MVSEFMFLTKMEKAKVIFSMVDDLMKETLLPKEVCFNFIAEYKGYSVAQIKNYVKLYDANFFYFAAMYDEDGTLLTVQDIDNRIKNILSKKVKPMIEKTDIKLTKDVLKEFSYNTKW